jgi:hypothetical protein
MEVDMATTKTTLAAVETKTAESRPAARDAQPVAREPKSFGITLVSASGELLRLRAHRVKTGWITDVTHRVGKKNTRGATQHHATPEAARTAIEAVATRAAKAGWERRETRIVRKEDAFDLAHLPTPSPTGGGKGKK